MANLLKGKDAKLWVYIFSRYDCQAAENRLVSWGLLDNFFLLFSGLGSKKRPSFFIKFFFG
jgi:hypothetical protein